MQIFSFGNYAVWCTYGFRVNRVASKIFVQR